MTPVFHCWPNCLYQWNPRTWWFSCLSVTVDTGIPAGLPVCQYLWIPVCLIVCLLVSVFFSPVPDCFLPVSICVTYNTRWFACLSVCVWPLELRICLSVSICVIHAHDGLSVCQYRNLMVFSVCQFLCGWWLACVHFCMTVSVFQYLCDRCARWLVCLSVCQYLCNRSTQWFVCLYLCDSGTRWFVCLSVSICVTAVPPGLSVCLFACLSVSVWQRYPLVCLSVCQ